MALVALNDFTNATTTAQMQFYCVCIVSLCMRECRFSIFEIGNKVRLQKIFFFHFLQIHMSLRVTSVFTVTKAVSAIILQLANLLGIT